MCQAIVKPETITLTKAELKRCWQGNPHGAGFAYRERSRVHIAKGFTTFKAFWRVYRQYQRHECIIHFRFATHGSRTVDNCHPFAVAPDTALIHNGILTNFTPPSGSDHSDTRHFVESYLKPSLQAVHHPPYETLQYWKRFLEGLIGSNKLAILTGHGSIIINEQFGEWRNGAWFSAGYPDVYEETWTRRYSSYAFDGLDDWTDEQWSREEDAEGEQQECAICTLDAPRALMYRLGSEGEVCRECWNDLHVYDEV